MVETGDYPAGKCLLHASAGAGRQGQDEQVAQAAVSISDGRIRSKRVIMKVCTDPGTSQLSDPGRVEGNPVFIYLDAFCKPEDFAAFCRNTAAWRSSKTTIASAVWGMSRLNGSSIRCCRRSCGPSVSVVRNGSVTFRGSRHSPREAAGRTQKKRRADPGGCAARDADRLF